MQIGILYGISLGTGDPELITVKGLRLLQKASVVAFPAGLGGKPGIAEQIASPWLDANQQKLALHFPYVQDEAVLQQAWQEAAKRVWLHLKLGHDVAFVCEGDISFYSTFTYLAQTLVALHPEAVIERVPGVCSPMAAAAEVGMPLTVRSDRLVVLPALYTVQELEAILEWADVVVLMKVSSVYDRVWQVLQQRDLLDRSWVVERATFPDRVIYIDLRDRPSLKLSYFSLLVISVKQSLRSQ
ncbi:precorrin-2 C(20)-methyltransferase [Hydrococcus rivularis NIES-593]|uniref:Precorrin-2 C(20)-methyltransferase n=1 Tax=Hydrococcus rivularis NIES-593 TaxID=1921803 RepID=A0A1U7H994_9CYAN|nr:precorrin-2 C(20)-methyltransferase [Hydrococcus rivularis]OKH20150.1 precorrin-2 C(20)-methyltransferase [Hydrococcus rivularis NIES-593]